VLQKVGVSFDLDCFVLHLVGQLLNTF